MRLLKRSAPRRIPAHALVVGGSIAGLMAARVLSEHVERVTLIERDQLPTSPEYRKGVPQAHHQHVLLSRGRKVMERWFPGFDRELAKAGAPLADYTRDFVLVSAAGRLPRFFSDIELRLCRRIHIDHALVNAVKRIANVTVHQGVAVSGYETDATRSRIIGVRTRSGELIRADLVIDATGRGSRTPKWLSDMGYEPPREEVVDAQLGYATRIYEKPLADVADYRAVEVAAVPPNNPRAAGLWEVEGNRWLLTLIGTAGEHPPTDEAGFNEFARSLSDPLVHETISRAKPITDIVPFTGTANRLRHYEKLARMPDGLLVIGDAYAAFNPIYGQGMTISALEGDVLDGALRSARKGTRIDHRQLRRAFYRAARPIVSNAWLLATSEDLRWPTTQGERTALVRASLAYFELLMPLSTESPELIRTFLNIANFESSSWALAKPRILLELARLLRKRGFAAHEPAPSAVGPMAGTEPGRSEAVSQPRHELSSSPA